MHFSDFLIKDNIKITMLPRILFFLVTLQVVNSLFDFFCSLLFIIFSTDLRQFTSNSKHKLRFAHVSFESNGELFGESEKGSQEKVLSWSRFSCSDKDDGSCDCRLEIFLARNGNVQLVLWCKKIICQILKI